MKKLAKEIWEGYKKFGKIIAEPINTIILTVIYILGIGIPSVLGKIFKKEFLEFSPKTNLENSYWQELKISQKETDLHRQF